MKFRVAVASIGALVVVGCSTPPQPQHPPTVTLTWAGTTVTKGSTRVPDATSPTGYRSRMTWWAPASDASPIHAALGTSMGVAFILSNTGAAGPIPVQVTWIFPSPGIRWHDADGGPRSSDRTVQYCIDGQETLAGWRFSEPSELVPGTWSVELAIAGNTFLRRQFDVVVP
jgi:hypothetical protein